MPALPVPITKITFNPGHDWESRRGLVGDVPTRRTCGAGRPTQLSECTARDDTCTVTADPPAFLQYMTD